MSGFINSAQYKGALEGGQQAITRGNIGNLFGGGTTADLVRFGQNNANMFGNDYWNKLAGQAGQAQGAASGLGQLGQSYAGMNNAATQNAANARGSAYANSANAWSNFGNQLSGMIGYGQGGGWGKSAQPPAAQSQWGAFAPQQQQPAWNGSSAFGQWGQGWANG